MILAYVWWKGQGGGLGDLFRDCAVKSIQVWYHLFWNFLGSEVLREHVCQGLWVLLHQAAQCLEPPPLFMLPHTRWPLSYFGVCVCVQFSKYTNLVLTLWLLFLIFLFWMFFSLFCLVLSHFSALGSDLVVSAMAFLHQSKLGSTIVSLSKEMTILWELTQCW